MISDDTKHQKILETAILTATKEELILKVYDYLIMSASQACDRFHNAAHDVEGIHIALQRSQKALTLLMGSLNFEIGGEVATNLFRVYEWWHHELVLANMSRDPARVERLIPVFKDYRATWAKAFAEFKTIQRTTNSAEAKGSFVAVG